MDGLETLRRCMALFNKIYGTYKNGILYNDEEVMQQWLEELQELITSLINFKISEGIRFYDLQFEKQNEIFNSEIKSDLEKTLEKISELEKMIDLQQSKGDLNGH